MPCRRCLLLLALLPAALPARTPLGTYAGWAAFRDASPRRCFAIAEPVVRSRGGRVERAFASVSSWPARGVRGEVQLRLRRPRDETKPATLTLAGRRFRLVGRGGDLWAPDARTDAAIVTAMRGGSAMSVEARDSDGRIMVDAYALAGAATAIDAATLGCLAR